MFQFEDYIGYPYDCADGNLYFKDVVLKKPIGSYLIGTKFPRVEFIGELMELRFFAYSEERHEYVNVMACNFDLVVKQNEPYLNSYLMGR